jgi:hypothetical protein
MAARKKARKKGKAKKTTKGRKVKGKAWTGDEIKKLRTGYKSKPASQIAKELRRSLASVRGKISALGLIKGHAKRRAKPKAKPKKKAKAKGKRRRR